MLGGFCHDLQTLTMPPHLHFKREFEARGGEHTMMERKEKGAGEEKMRVPNQDTQYLSRKSSRIKEQMKQGIRVGEGRALFKQFK